MRRIWTMLAAAAVVAGYLAVVSPAQAATPKQLLARYQPVTLMDPLEPFRPTDVNGFVRDSVLETQSSPGVWTLVDGNPTLGTLPTRSSDSCATQGLVDCYRLNQQSCSATQTSSPARSWSTAYSALPAASSTCATPGTPASSCRTVSTSDGSAT